MEGLLSTGPTPSSFNTYTKLSSQSVQICNQNNPAVGLGALAPYLQIKGVLGNLGNVLCHLVITRDFKRNLEKFSRCRALKKGDTISSCDELSLPPWHEGRLNNNKK